MCIRDSFEGKATTLKYITAENTPENKSKLKANEIDFKEEGKRIKIDGINANHRLRKIKEREREKLLSDEGLKYRSQRPQDVEAVFGNLDVYKRQAGDLYITFVIAEDPVFKRLGDDLYRSPAGPPLIPSPP